MSKSNRISLRRLQSYPLGPGRAESRKGLEMAARDVPGRLALTRLKFRILVSSEEKKGETSHGGGREN